MITTERVDVWDSTNAELYMCGVILAVKSIKPFRIVGDDGLDYITPKRIIAVAHHSTNYVWLLYVEDGVKIPKPFTPVGIEYKDFLRVGQGDNDFKIRLVERFEDISPLSSKAIEDSFIKNGLGVGE